jgi:methanogenesis imperfect marker protein 11
VILDVTPIFTKIFNKENRKEEMKNKPRKLSQEALKKEFKNVSWVMPYNSVKAMYDETSDTVMLIESYGPPEGFFIEAWRSHHFPKTSKIVTKSYREGGQSIFIIKPGKSKLDLIPAFAPIGIEECRVLDKTIEVTYAGHGGGGVSAAYSRGLAKGALSVEVISPGGGQKLGKGKVVLPRKKLVLVGVDDTDNKELGATYALAHNIATKLSKTKGIDYVIHNNIQLFPANPDKTKNCMATVIGFCIDPELKSKVVDTFKKELEENTYSENTAMCVSESIDISPSLLAYANKAKSEFISSIDEVKQVAKENNIDIYPIKSNRGLIGAVASMGLYDCPDYASGLLPGQKVD